jgi:hypothetical protein
VAVSLMGSHVFGKSAGAHPAAVAAGKRGCSYHAGGCVFKPTPPAYGGTGGPSQGGVDNPHRHPK